MSKKNKSEVKETPPPQNNQPKAGTQEQTEAETMFLSDADEAMFLSDADEALMQIAHQALRLWQAEGLRELIYPINRTFAHYRLREKYDLEKTFLGPLQRIHGGKADTFLQDSEEFIGHVMKWLESYLEATEKKH